MLANPCSHSSLSPPSPMLYLFLFYLIVECQVRKQHVPIVKCLVWLGQGSNFWPQGRRADELIITSHRVWYKCTLTLTLFLLDSCFLLFLFSCVRARECASCCWWLLSPDVGGFQEMEQRLCVCVCVCVCVCCVCVCVSKRLRATAAWRNCHHLGSEICPGKRQSAVISQLTYMPLLLTLTPFLRWVEPSENGGFDAIWIDLHSIFWRIDLLRTLLKFSWIPLRLYAALGILFFRDSLLV